MNNKNYTAIIFFIPGKNQAPVMKYRKISNIDKFAAFAALKYPGKISSINFYDCNTRQFFKQIKISLPK